MGSTRIRGNKLRLTLDSEDFWADATSVVLEAEDSDDVLTFEDAAGAGNRQFFFNISAVQSMEPTSFWRYCWDHAGEVVPFSYAPLGNETPTTNAPHFTGTCKIGPRPNVGGEASRTGSFTFETRFDVETGPVLDTGSGSGD